MHYKVIFNKNCNENIANVQAECLPTDIKRENFDHAWDFPFTISVLSFDSLHGPEFCLKIKHLNNITIILMCIQNDYNTYLMYSIMHQQIDEINLVGIETYSKTEKWTSLKPLYLTTHLI